MVVAMTLAVLVSFAGGIWVGLVLNLYGVNNGK